MEKLGQELSDVYERTKLRNIKNNGNELNIVNLDGLIENLDKEVERLRKEICKKILETRNNVGDLINKQ